MRTTVTIDDRVYEAARHQAEILHVPLGEFIQTAMNQALTASTAPDTDIPPYQPPRIRSGLRDGLTVESVSAALDAGEDAATVARLAQL
jgi:hypothetical protein